MVRAGGVALVAQRGRGAAAVEHGGFAGRGGGRGGWGGVAAAEERHGCGSGWGGGCGLSWDGKVGSDLVQNDLDKM